MDPLRQLPREMGAGLRTGAKEGLPHPGAGCGRVDCVKTSH